MLTYHLCDFVFVIMIKNFGGEYEQIFYVFTCFCGCFETEQNVAISLELLDTVGSDFTLLFLILLIANEE